MQDKILPKYFKNEALGSKGVRMVANAVEDELSWIFRVKETADIGIDGEIEVIEDGYSTGKLLALQIKCGQSFFKETCEIGYVFRCNEAKVNYWLSLSIPVILCLCNEKNNKIFWVNITVDTVYKLKKGYKVIVPFNNELNSKNKYALENVIRSNPLIDEIVESAIFKYLYERYKHNIKICPDIELPRDFTQLSYLAEIKGETYLIGSIIDRYGYFDINDVKEIIGIYHKNRKFFCWDYYDVKSKLLVFFVSESLDHLQLKEDIIELLNKNEVEFDRLYLSKEFLSATLIRGDGAEIWFYNEDGSIDEGQIFSIHNFT
ncbi:DUF4365 domain-containing protein [Clostridium perfringens]|nr:DUF4365 domain-containing protein [Clostridium perfringens]